MSTFVLVHGAWHGGWCYQRVARLLRAQGHDVYTPTLTGVGERAHLDAGTVNLSLHIQDVRNMLRWEALSDVVLLGHSYGGMVISGVADAEPERIAALVYLDAFVPEDGRSALDYLPEASRANFLAGAAADCGYRVPPISAETFQVNAADRAWVDAMCVPMSLACFHERIALSGAWERVKRRAYIYAAGRGTSTMTPFYERLKSDPGWQVHEVPCGHDVMVDMPEELAALLVGIAQG